MKSDARAEHYRTGLPIKVTHGLLRYLLILTITSTVSFADSNVDNPPLIGIQGIDDRIIVNGSQAPWQAIGKVHTADLFICLHRSANHSQTRINRCPLYLE